MIVELFPFQKVAEEQLRKDAATALGLYRRTRQSQVISFTAPTGAGKTIILAALIEDIYCGNEWIPEQPDAIFVWLSDSPELNQQSRDKIALKADRIDYSQCVMISDDSFDQEYLEDGHIYFLNTQKLGKSSNLTKHGDSRTWTIWETLRNTMEEKSDRLYFIIDEAHRGMQGNAAAKATTIMQKFLKGSRDDDLPPAPLVIGMSATPERFNRLVEGIDSTTQKVIVPVDDVRKSGLLKERIIIAYPDDPSGIKDMAVLQAAADDWKEKWVHWYQYCQEQHYSHVNPVFVIQVQNQTGSSISDTDLSDCVQKIEERTGFRFSAGEVVHTFGQTTSPLILNGVEVRYVEPSRIADDRNIRIVFFKENLSTGWDCPRAETMMSFRRATDATYVAQLLGRMIRTPMQSHIQVDDVLNDVHLFLPYFDADTVKEIVDALQSAEGGDIPADIYGEGFDSPRSEVWSVRGGSRTGTQVPDSTGQQETMNFEGQNASVETDPVNPLSDHGNHFGGFDDLPLFDPNLNNPVTSAVPASAGDSQTAQRPALHGNGSLSAGPQLPPVQEFMPEVGIDREGILDAINSMGLITYSVRSTRINNYLKSLFGIAHLLTQSHVEPRAVEEVQSEIVGMIRQHINLLKQQGKYEDLKTQVLQFRMKTQAFDVFGESVDNYTETDVFSSTDLDLDRNFRAADVILGREGIGFRYGNKYYDEDDPNAHMIDVIIFANDANCINNLFDYAKAKFEDLDDQNRRRIQALSERYRLKYKEIVTNSEEVTKLTFELPEYINMNLNEGGDNYPDHLYLNKNNEAHILLNNWEKAVLQEEQNRPDFICWLRNPPRKPWALCIPYEQNGETKRLFPDFLIVRKDDAGYVVDVLEPHDGSFADNLGKAKGMAKYAKENAGIIGRVQLIRQINGVFKRLELGSNSVRDQVLHCGSDDQLNYVFSQFGING